MQKKAARPTSAQKAARLKAELHAAKAHQLLTDRSLESHIKAIEDQRETHRRVVVKLDEMIKSRNATIETQKGKINEVRGQLFAALQENARFRGYIQGQIDAQPPRMVPEPKEHPLANFPDMGWQAPHAYDAFGRPSSTQPKRWFDK